MSLQIVLSKRFKKDLKLAKQRGLDLNLLNKIVDKLANGEKLDEKYRDHELFGDLFSM
ncbi:type II toxin-antitoxin system mRNA interferase toxin, RelE/StbE family [Amygdalobacter nucleatus]|uniref:type II toxin-antitoxin system mRNA interferase toxin, RelE/StbE family n=1 Tax=Amygdalobacter nucleatus TaxID=3029274 RepID=UPI0027A33FB2|nr:type II toxin-antitoxin system mRNA interferase toxin, RelE/StbE family [Amygdalobacter nucleatus]WEG37089.1 type II toxin-antitoxin system mRNA interferase toxin, RelE/StbE family [Amygdalobacter nucleatus]